MILKRARPALPFIFVTVFIDVLGIGIALPVLPALVGELTGSRELQSYWYGALAVAYGLMQFVCAPLLGALSDRFGRRPLLLLVAARPRRAFLPARDRADAAAHAGGAGAGWHRRGELRGRNAYAADMTPPEQRAKGFGMVGAAFGLGFIFGPMAGGLLGGVSLRLPFYVAAGLSLLNATYGFSSVPSRCRAERRAEFSLARANPLAALPRLMRRRDIGGLVLRRRPRGAGATDAAGELGALHDVSLRLGPARQRLGAVHRRRRGRRSCRAD